MRIALISDLHGNEVALRAVLADVERVGVDQLVCLGDVATLGPSPGAVLQILRDLGCVCILGNHDEFLFNPDLIRSYTELPMIVEAVEWCRCGLSAADVGFVQTFRATLEVPLEGGATLLLFHGSPRSHMEDLLSTTPPAALDELLAGRVATVMAGGHTHVQMLRQHHGMLLVNPGSVGMPFKEHVAGGPPTLMRHAEYAVVESTGSGVSVSLRRVPVDLESVRRAVAASDNPLRGALLQQYA